MADRSGIWIEGEFQPCTIFYPEAGFTEMVLADRPVVWSEAREWVQVGHDMETGELIAMRIAGDHETRKR